MALNKYQATDFVFMNQFVVHTPGWLLTGYGWKGDNNQFHDGTIFNDAANWCYLGWKSSLGAGETIMAKTHFEEWLWDLACAEIKHIHINNQVFTADVFPTDCTEKHQSQSFSGVGTHHQNAHASCTWHERSCYMFHFIGPNMVLTIWHYGHLLSSMLPGCTIENLAELQGLLHLRCSWRLILIIKIL